MGGLLAIFGTIVALIAGVVALVLLMILLVRVFGVLGTFFAHIGRFLIRMIGDTARLVGAMILTLVLVPFIFLNVIIGRWSAASHYGTALKREIGAAGGCVYRVLIQHPLTLLGLRGITEGLENRLPQVMAEAPGRDKPAGAAKLYDGYTILGSLAGGGSGAKLYVAQPDPMKRAIFERQGQGDLGRVVIKAFDLRDGSSLPQIVRESRALDAAKNLGLILEHELNAERFHYVMRFVPGESMAAVSNTLHARSGAGGLDPRYLNTGLGYVRDLLVTLDTYHRGGLWHKDVKPDNIIVDNTEGGDNKAHLVDFGLVTPLRSAMTLTTHGTEYFRDPDLVRMAQRGVKVGDVDGAKFDIYAAGAVLYALIENSFPAHGGLSQFSKTCPDSLRWIVRRSMASYEQRYATAAEMLADLEYVRKHDAAKVKPAELPSVAGGSLADDLPEPEADPVFQPMAPVEPVTIQANHPQAKASSRNNRTGDETDAQVFVLGAGIGPKGPFAGVHHAGSPRPHATTPRKRPKLRISSWWTGAYELAHEPTHGTPHPASAGEAQRARAPQAYHKSQGMPFTPVAPAARAVPGSGAVWTPRSEDLPRHSAAEQRRHARERIAQRRSQVGRRLAHQRRQARTGRGDPAKLNSGVLLGIALPMAALAIIITFFLTREGERVVNNAVSNVRVGGMENNARASVHTNGFELRGFGDAPELPELPAAPSAADGSAQAQHALPRSEALPSTVNGIQWLNLSELTGIDQLGDLGLSDESQGEIELPELTRRLKDISSRFSGQLKANQKRAIERVIALAALHGIAAGDIQGAMGGHRVLVISELAAPVDPALAAEVGLSLDALRSVGIELVGDVHAFPGTLGTDATTELDQSLIADARYRLGQIERQSLIARNTLANIVRANDGVDAVILLAPELTEAGNSRDRTDIRAVTVNAQHGATRLIRDEAATRLLELLDRLVTYKD